VRAVALALAVLVADVAAAEPNVVVSPAPEDVAVTLYRYDLALVRETRSVELPEGLAVVELRGVSDSILPGSATVEGLDGLIERNFDYAVLSGESLVRTSLRQQVSVRRTQPGSGKTTLEPATLIAGEHGVLVDFGEGRIEALDCSGLAEALVFDRVPATLRAEPTLSVRVRSESAGRRTLELLYLASGLSWSADYNLRLSPDGHSFDLEGWLTLSNRSGTTFANAETAVLAGELNRGYELPWRLSLRAAESHCWPFGDLWSSKRSELEREIESELKRSEELMLNIEEITVTARKREPSVYAELEALLDYHLYRVPWRTSVAARQSKQIRFIDRRGVRVEPLYLLDFGSEVVEEALEPVDAMAALRFVNRGQDGLGLPLPEGKISVTQQTDREYLLIGQDAIRNIPVNLPVELSIAYAIGVSDRINVRDLSKRTLLFSLFRGRALSVTQATIEHEIVNSKDAPVVVEVRQSLYEVEISRASRPWRRERDAAIWRLEIPARSSVRLEYRARVREDWEDWES